LPGDRYGGPGHRKVKKMLLSGRVPVPKRTNIPLVAAEDVVVWIPGFRPAKIFAAKANSGRSVLIEARKR
jgi:tRNA(Ile)-lysidine synthetase-like protein